MIEAFVCGMVTFIELIIVLAIGFTSLILIQFIVYRLTKISLYNNFRNYIKKEIER